MHMNKQAEHIELVKQQGVLPLFYHDEMEVSIGVIHALYRAGIRAIEYTNRGAQALDNFKKLIEIRNNEWPGLLLGIGTIKTAEQASLFVEAGADYIISPGLSLAVADVAHKAGLAWIPGCVTPTEIMTAEQNNAMLVKLFPGTLLGPSYVSAVKEVFPGLLFMPTGGVEVNEESMRAWFEAGVCAVGLGSKVVSKSLMEKKDYAAIEVLAKQALTIVEKVRM